MQYKHPPMPQKDTNKAKSCLILQADDAGVKTRYIYMSYAIKTRSREPADARNAG